MTTPDTIADTPAQSARSLSALVYHPEEGIHTEILPEAISEALVNPSVLVWLDITAPTSEDMSLLEEEFSLHPLALEEIITPHPRAKCEEYPGFYVLVMYAADHSSDPEAEERLRLCEVVIYISQQFLITAHQEPFPEIAECVRRWQTNASRHGATIAMPVYALLDTIVDGYFPILDHIAEDVDDIEDSLFSGDGAERSQNLFALKKEMLTLRRALAGQRDALNLILRQDVPVFPERTLLYFQSVYDHLVRLVESVDTYRDLISSAMDMHLSIVSNRMSQVMKTLTVISTILMSATLIAGIYGMNFKHMPELNWDNGYYMALGAMLVVAAGLAAFFRKIKWF
jgi:magnesium transporter